MEVEKNSEVNDVINAAAEISADQSQDRFMEDTIYLAQVVFSNIDSLNRREIDKQYFSEVKPMMLKFLTDRDFPQVPLARLLDGGTLDGSDRTNLRDFVAAKGGFDALSMFFGSTGLLNEVLKITGKYFPQTYRWTEKYFDIQSLSYASSVCATMLLLYPHESFGRYPENIMGTTTESIYKDKALKVLQYIRDC